MNIKIQSLRFDADKKLEELIEKKMNKLAQFYDNITDAEVILRLEKSDVRENKVVEIKIFVKGSDFFSKKHASSFEEAFEETHDAIKNQLVKHKEKIRN